ncbi:MAG: hypothetical protein FJZ47_08505 [Candidatus Tectomicrobia bacterium]|uniref:Uncharacterized protein n=1 Tax=Tectimicrobiota bacterium TaxID=2528274 RepID=A0A937W259_UNCTE|nr:hypothetical protein [Candidatus Tectomicrobia bacterium]
MKRFAQCVHCQQWYVHTYTTTVEIYQHDRLYGLAIWCLRCIQAAEQRSHISETWHDEPSVLPPPGAQHEEAMSQPSPETFQGLVQEHLQLMDRALYDDETLLVPAVAAFLERCRISLDTIESPEHDQRLRGHVQYWETFLTTLRS